MPSLRPVTRRLDETLNQPRPGHKSCPSFHGKIYRYAKNREISREQFLPTHIMHRPFSRRARSRQTRRHTPNILPSHWNKHCFAGTPKVQRRNGGRVQPPKRYVFALASSEVVRNTSRHQLAQNHLYPQHDGGRNKPHLHINIRIASKV